MKLVQPSTLLRRALLIDAAASGAVAALQLAAGATLAAVTSLPPALLLESGLFLVAYVMLLLAMASIATAPKALVQVVIIGNCGWALGALGVALALAPTGWGWAWLAAQAAAVLAFAALEQAGLQRSPEVGARAPHPMAG